MNTPHSRNIAAWLRLIDLLIEANKAGLLHRLARQGVSEIGS